MLAVGLFDPQPADKQDLSIMETLNENQY